MICTPNLPFNFKFTVKEAATAFQPKIDPNAFKFEQINDHCLLHIASYLNFVDIVNLGKSSTRLQSLVQLIYRKKSFFSFGTSTGDSSINASNLEFVLKELGSYIKSIKWTELESNHLDYLSQFCPNVTELKLINTWRLHMPTIKKNKSFFKNIEILDISLSSFFDSALQPITSSSRVKSLRLENCSNICGKFFCKWKKSKLKCLTLSNCRKVDCNNVFDFVRNNKLVKFSFDGRSDSIVRQDLSLSSECVSELVELELNYSLFTGDRVAILDFRDLKRVAHFTLTSTTVCQNVNKVLAAVSQIPTLRSLTVQQICIDADTLKCLGSFKTLQKIHFDGMEIGIGRQFFSSLHIHLPEITELIISPYIYNAQLNWFCEMISSLNALKTFSYAAMTWELLDMVLQEQVRLKRPTIEIKVWKHLFDDPKKVSALFKGRHTLRLNAFKSIHVFKSPEFFALSLLNGLSKSDCRLHVRFRLQLAQYSIF